MYLTAFLCMHHLNFILINVWPLTDTACSGIPNNAIILHKQGIVAHAMMQDIRFMPKHLKCE